MAKNAAFGRNSEIITSCRRFYSVNTLGSRHGINSLTYGIISSVFGNCCGRREVPH